VGPDVVYADPI
jgi:hypothetical protein